MTFLSIIVDTVAFLLRLPQAKLERLQQILREWGHSLSGTRKQLEQLLGHLSHAAIVIHPGRVFLR